MIEPNQIYVNPPNADLTISDGRLHLTTPQAPGRPPFPIDMTHVFQKIGPLTFLVSGQPVELDQDHVAILTFRPVERGTKEGD